MVSTRGGGGGGGRGRNAGEVVTAAVAGAVVASEVDVGGGVESAEIAGATGSGGGTAELVTAELVAAELVAAKLVAAKLVADGATTATVALVASVEFWTGSVPSPIARPR